MCLDSFEMWTRKGTAEGCRAISRTTMLQEGGASGRGLVVDVAERKGAAEG